MRPDVASVFVALAVAAVLVMAIAAIVGLERRKRRADVDQRVLDAVASVLPLDRSASDPMRSVAVELTNAVPAGRDHTELKANGQQLAYVVLTPEERAKGFVRPLRDSYRHVGIRPAGPTRELTPEEHERYDKLGYVLHEQYPPGHVLSHGRFWTKAMLNSCCGSVTRMGTSIAETYARDPKFYGGTFCLGCGKHLPVEEFVWLGTSERVGS
jgi:hypothetical protein